MHQNMSLTSFRFWILCCFIHCAKPASCAKLPQGWKSRIHSSILEADESLTGNDIIWNEDASGHMAAHGNESGQIARRLITDALRTIERRTDNCLNFKIRSDEKEYIGFFPGRGCNSQVGRVPGSVTHIKLGSRCMAEGIILHEILHALGFYHEQNRPDRDDYVQVFVDHIQPGMYNMNYRILPNMSTHGVQYDFDSILHYSPFEFAISRKRPAMLPRFGKDKMIGQRRRLSSQDETKIKKAYGCIDENFEKVPQTPAVCRDSAGNEASSFRITATSDRSTTTMKSSTRKRTTTTESPPNLGYAPASLQSSGNIFNGPVRGVDVSCTVLCTTWWLCTIANIENPRTCGGQPPRCNCNEFAFG
ncbi:zinc metalloproteinase nas-14-like isoform X2 [Paramacrobiotus metropolitanus]|uniref:zinc metalloproteinase nas-14-like isoform X2 n=1 Tax=Paramacrobiotus metropolitanus TaxID=2943436 RepID=UPI0024462753|nr:zinc metalloproteinase nas-14-like isoform X2 [Paramacrobiotus metropolitanus]